MSSSIYTVVPDIYDLIKRKDGWFTEELSQTFSADVAKRLQVHLNESHGPPRLRMSKMGPQCPCALWHSIHKPELAEPLPPKAMIKYSYGHVLEAFAIMLAKAAGHEVLGEQDELHLDGITGHRDCVLDGCVCDVKSASSYSFQRFASGTLGTDDPFGYLEQLECYVLASHSDPLVRCKDRGYILAIDKVSGELALYEHQIRSDRIKSRIADYRRIVGRPTPPPCACGTVPKGKSGNIGLDTRASYSPYKHVCFPNLRTFIYADGPVYLTNVVRTPDVPEVDRYGKPVH
jgi:hypothetical protein